MPAERTTAMLEQEKIQCQKHTSEFLSNFARSLSELVKIQLTDGSTPTYSEIVEEISYRMRWEKITVENLLAGNICESDWTVMVCIRLLYVFGGVLEVSIRPREGYDEKDYEKERESESDRPQVQCDHKRAEPKTED